MRTAPKVALSLLFSLLLFLGLGVAAYAGLFNVLETRFYQPSVIRTLEDNVQAVAESLDEWHSENMRAFSLFVAEDSVKRSLLPNQDSADIMNRAQKSGTLLAERPGLSGIRIIDAGEIQGSGEGVTRKIHFSTFESDLLKKEDFRISYNAYGKASLDLPFAALNVPAGAEPKIAYDRGLDRFCYCVAFYDSYGAWRGVAVFYVTARSAVQHLVSKGLLRLSDEASLVSDPEQRVRGFVTGLPPVGRDIVENAIIEKWKSGNLATERVVASSDSGWVLLSRQKGPHGIAASVIEDTLFTFPQSVRILFLSISFLTFFLLVFLFLNLRQDDMAIVRSRIKKFQFHLLEELIQSGERESWEEIGKNISWRKREVNGEIKKGFGKRIIKRHGEAIDALLDKSWDEVLSAIGNQGAKDQSRLDIESIRLMLEEVLQHNAVSLKIAGVTDARAQAPSVQRTGPAAAAGIPQTAAPSDIEELEELEDIESAEELDEIEEVQAVGEPAPAGIPQTAAPSDIEELEELEDVEPAGELDEIEELEDIEPAGELDEIEELEDIEPAEAVEDLADAEPLEEPTPITAPPPPASANEYVVDMDTESPALIDFELGDRALDAADAEELEYLDSEWEPELLEAASDEELRDFVEQMYPDEVLVYNFDETPSLDHGARAFVDLSSLDEDTKAISIAGLDFTELDSLAHANIEASDAVDGAADSEAAQGALEEYDEEDIPEVIYISSSALFDITAVHGMEDSGPVLECLEVIGEEEPGDLEDIDRDSRSGGTIVTEEGVFVVAGNAPTDSVPMDSDFKNLVDSVLSRAHR